MTKTKQAADHSANNLPPSVERTNQKNVPSAQSYHVAQILGTGKKNRITSAELCSFCHGQIKKQLDSVTFFRKQIKDYDVSQQASIQRLIGEVD